MSVPSPSGDPVLSGWTIRAIAQAPPGSLTISLDLGQSRETVERSEAGILLNNGRSVTIDALESELRHPEDCVQIEAVGPRRIYFYSERTGNYYQLYQPAQNLAPTVVIGGATMHSIVDREPWKDQEEKVRALGGGGGTCLDTCFGLGYSAQLLARTGFDKVVSCEVDANVLRCAARNPWSRPSFTHAGIEIRPADLRKVVQNAPPEFYSAIFHDPPTPDQAGELYAGSLYKQFFETLKRGGKLYHYVGAPGAKGGRDYARGVMRRLQEGGFRKTRRAARGVLAVKG